MSRERHLAAIMFTDIVGYTAMMQENEEAAATVRDKHRQVFEDEHSKFNGRLLQYYGDGTLSTFSSAVEAVQCAIKMQHEFQTGHKVPLRIGIHLGDIVFDDNDVYGDGVNLASRIESLGTEGSILISENLNMAVQNQPSIKTVSLGHYEFKNVKEAIEVFYIKNDFLKIPLKSELTGKTKGKVKSIAVLPFVNMSADPENEYFSDGIAEEILNALTRVQGLQVTARTSSFAFKGNNIDVREIGKKLNVAHILEGSVRKSGNRIRVTAQLISALDGYHFFSETYDRTLDDIFAVQDEIASKITHKLRQHLGEEEHKKKLVLAPTENIEAYEIYLKGSYLFNQWGDSMVKAVPFFKKAIELQSDFALPHTKLVLASFYQAFGGFITWDVAYDNCRHHLERARALNADSAEYYFAEFIYSFFAKWDWAAAAEIAKKGIAANPNFGSLYHCVSSLHWIQVEMENAKDVLYKGYLRDPLSVEMTLYMGSVLLWNDRYRESIKYYEKVLELVPKHRTAIEYLGWVDFLQHDYKSAIEKFKLIDPSQGYRFHKATCLGCAYYMNGNEAKYLECEAELKTWEASPGGGVGSLMDMAVINTWTGNHDLAFEYLLKALENKVGSIMFCRADPMIKPLFTEERLKIVSGILGEMPVFDIDLSDY